MHVHGYITLILVVAVLAGLFFVSPFLQNLFFAVAEDAKSYAVEHTAIAMGFFALLAALSAMISPFSSVPIVPLAIALWGIPTVIVLLIGGWLLGDCLAYIIGRCAGNPIIRQFMKEERLARYENHVSARMTFLRALLLRLALPAEVGYAFGLIRYAFVPYFIVTFLAEMPFAFLIVLTADALIALNALRFAEFLALLILLVGGAYVFLRRRA